jgi:hypothetical protein
MLKTRIALLGALALLIASGVATSTASAAGPYWHVGGTRLGQGAIKQVKLQSKGIVIFKGQAFGITAEVTCRTSISEGATIEGRGNFQGQDKGRFIFRQCTTVSNAGCKALEPITTNQLKSYLAYNPNSRQQKFVDVLEPQQGTRVGEIQFKECILEAASLDGSIAAEILPIEKENQENLLNFPEQPITEVVHEQQAKRIGLRFAGEPMVFAGAYGARLVTNERWGVFGQ